MTMQFKHLQTIHQPPSGDGLVKVTAICWAPNGKRLAVCTTDRVVVMFDEDGVKKDKFSTKPADKVDRLSDIDMTLFDAMHVGTEELCRYPNGLLSWIR